MHYQCQIDFSFEYYDNFAKIKHKASVFKGCPKFFTLPKSKNHEIMERDAYL